MKEFINFGKDVSNKKAFSNAIKVDVGDSEMLFIAGNIAKDENGNIVGLGDYAAQAEYIFSKIEEILKLAGMTINDLVKVNMYLVDMEQFEKVSAVRNKYLDESRPVSTAVGILGTVTEGCDLEIEAIAVKKKTS